MKTGEYEVVEASRMMGFARLRGVGGEIVVGELELRTGLEHQLLKLGDIVRGELVQPRAAALPPRLSSASLVRRATPPHDVLDRVREVFTALADRGLAIDADPMEVAHAEWRLPPDGAVGGRVPCCPSHSPLRAAVHQRLEFLFRLGEDSHPCDDATLFTRLSSAMRGQGATFDAEIRQVGERWLFRRLGHPELLAGGEWGDQDAPVPIFRPLVEDANGELSRTLSDARWAPTPDEENWVLIWPALRDRLVALDALRDQPTAAL